MEGSMKWPEYKKLKLYKNDLIRWKSLDIVFLFSHTGISTCPNLQTCPDHCPLWLLVGTPSVLWPEHASRWAEHSLLWKMSLYIFDILFLSCLHNTFYGLSALVGCWSLLFKRRLFTNFYMRVLLITQLLRLVGRLGSHKPV